MPNEKRNRRARVRPEPPRPQLSSAVECFITEVVPLCQRLRRSSSRSERHLRNAAIEVLEAMRAVLDEGIAWLREEQDASELKRVRVED